MDSINKIVSKELQVLPLQEGEVKIARLLLYGKIDATTGQPIRKPSHTLAGRDKIRDPFDKNQSNKEIMNIAGHRAVNTPGGGTVMQAYEQSFRFDSSMQKTFTNENFDEYVFALLNNRNIDNPYRNKKKAAVYYFVDEVKEMNVEKVNFEYKMHAGGLLFTQTDEEMKEMAKRLLDAYPKKFDFSSTLEKASLRKVLQPLSQVHSAEFLLCSGNKEDAARVYVDAAITNRWILLDEAKEKVAKWMWVRLPNDKGKKSLIEVSKEDDARKVLIAFVASEDGGIDYAELKSRHEEYYAPQGV